MLTKEYFLFTKWDARDWSRNQKIQWQKAMFELGFKWQDDCREVFLSNSFPEESYFISRSGDISYGISMGDPSNIFHDDCRTQRYFHDILLSEPHAEKKAATPYVNLIDYLDKPELIQSVDGQLVKSIEKTTRSHPGMQVIVYFEGGSKNYYYDDGRLLERDTHSRFVLIGGKVKNPRDKVYDAINTERAYQDSLWDANTKSSGATSISAYILWMERYLHVARELASTTDETTGTPSANAIMDVIRKVAGLAVACGEIHGMPERDTSLVKPSKEQE